MFGTLILIGIAIPLKTNGDESKALPSPPKSPIELLSEKPSVRQIKEAIVFISDKYGLNETELYQTLKCESGFRFDAVGDNGKAKNVAQFHLPTFKKYCSGDYNSAKDQLICMAQMWQKGLQRHWTCWRNLNIPG